MIKLQQNIGKQCNSCKTGKYQEIRLAAFKFIICDNCGKNLIPVTKNN